MIDAMIARIGLTLDAEQREELLASSVALDRVLARLQGYLPRATEPAHVFNATRFNVAGADEAIPEGADEC